MTTVSKAILSSMLWIPKKEIQEDLSYIREELTFKSFFDTDEESEKLTKVYRQGKTWFGVPWYYPDKSGFLNIRNIKDKRSDGKFPIKFHVLSKARDDGQKAILRSFNDAVDKGISGMIINAPTAVGKTFLAIKMIQKLQRIALIIVHKSDLVDQWKNEILEHTNIPESKIGIGKLGKVDWQGRCVIISLVHTIALQRESEDFYKYPGVLIFDEVDRSVPPKTFAPVSCMFPARYRIALSATPKRSDGMHKIFELNVGGIIIKPPKDAELQRMDSIIIAKKYTAAKPISLPGHMDPVMKKAIFLKRIEKDPVRNSLICRYIKRFCNSTGRKVLVLSERLLQLHIIKLSLTKEFGIDSKKIGYYTASAVKLWNGKKKPSMRTVKKEEQQFTAENCDVMLATFKMMEAGTNIPELSGLVIATPQRSVKQALGRIERYYEGKKAPVVVDIIDSECEEALNWYNARLIEYKVRKLKIIEK